MASRRPQDRHAGVAQVLADVARRHDAVVQVVLVDGLLHADGERLEVASGQATVGGEALGEDQQVLVLAGELGVARGEEAADVDDRVLLGAHRAALRQVAHLLHDRADGAVALTRLALLDEVGVLGDAARVEVERRVELAADLGDRVHVARARPAGRRRSCW